MGDIMRTILCETWLYINLLGGAFFIAAIKQWVVAKKRSWFLIILGIICIIIPGVTYLNSTEVINVVGLQVDLARQTLQSSGLQVELDFADVNSEIILRQNILPGSYVKKDTLIVLYDEAYPPIEYLLEIESYKENNNLSFPVVNLADSKSSDILTEYTESIRKIILSSNFKDNLPFSLYKNVVLEVFEKAGTVYFKNADSFTSFDLLGEKVTSSHLLVMDYDTLNVVATYELENGSIENPFKNVKAGKYFIALLSNNYRVYIWGPIQLKDYWTGNLGGKNLPSISFALTPDDVMFSDIKSIKVENTESSIFPFIRPYFIDTVPISNKDIIKPVSSDPTSTIPTYKEIIALDASNNSSGVLLPVYAETNSYKYLSPPSNDKALYLFSISEKYMLRLEHKKTDRLDLFWKNCYIDIDFWKYNEDTIVIDSSNFLKS